MSYKLGDMCKSREVDSQDDNLWNSCQNLSVDKFFPEIYLAYSNKLDYDSHVEDMSFYILDSFPLKHFVNATSR